MRGAQLFLETLGAYGVDAMFGNPGTTENSVLDRLVEYPSIEYFVALHEGVAVTAASFYAQATGRPAVANVHVAPGLGNSIGSLYAALKSESPVIVTAGQQDTRMRLRSPLLGHDLVAMADPVTKWSGEPRTADEIAPMLARAFQIAMDPPAGPVFMALPVDVMEQETDVLPKNLHSFREGVDEAGLATIVTALRSAQTPAIVAGDDIARSNSVELVVELAETLGAAVFQEAMRVHAVFPNKHPQFQGRLPLEAASIAEALSSHDCIFLIGGAFFDEVWFDDEDPIPVSACAVRLERVPQRLTQNLRIDFGAAGSIHRSLEIILKSIPSSKSAGKLRERLLEASQIRTKTTQARLVRQRDSIPMSPMIAVDALARALPSDAIIVDESITASLDVNAMIQVSNRGDYYSGRGGGIGQGLAGAIGIQAAHPDRPVIAISGDGSAMYSITAFWTAAHHGLPIIFVILSNKEYRVLKHNLDIFRDRFDADSNRPYPHLDITGPDLGFVDMARGMGVGADRIEHPADIADAVTRALMAGRPYVLDIQVSGKR